MKNKIVHIFIGLLLCVAVTFSVSAQDAANGPNTADISLSITDNLDPIATGSTLVYTYTVTNAGPDTALDVAVSSPISSSIPAVTNGCAQDPVPFFFCSLGDIPAGSSASYTLAIDLGGFAPGPVVRNGFVSTSSTDPNAGNDAGSETTLIAERLVDLAVTKTDSTDPVAAGGSFSYQISVSNSGPATAENVIATDILPVGVSLVSTAGCTEDPNAVPDCSLGDIAPGTSVDYTIFVDVDPATLGDIVNTVTVISDLPEPFGFVAEGGTTPFGLPEFGSPTTGQGLIRPSFADIDNDGDLDLFVGQNQGAISFFRNTAGAGNDPVYVQEGGSTPFGLTDVGGFSAPVFADVDGDEDLDALIGEASGNVNFFRNTAGLNNDPVFVAEGGATPFGLPDVTNPGQGVGLSQPFLADVDGDGDLDALIGEFAGDINFFRNSAGVGNDPVFVQEGGVTPFGLENVGVGGIFGASSVPVLADIDDDGDLDAWIGGGNGTIQFYRNMAGFGNDPLFVREGGDSPFGLPDVGVSSTPFLADVEGDGDLDMVIGESEGVVNFFRNSLVGGSNTATETTTIREPMADLAITKTDDIDPAVAGTSLTYTIEVSNAGPETATNVVVTDLLPTGLTFVSGAGCVESPIGTVTCTLADILPGQSDSVTITADIDSAISGSLTNTASVESEIIDPDPANNSVSEDTAVVREADLSISKTDNVDPITAGQQLTYTITVQNTGPSLADSVSVVDALPTGVTFLSTDGCLNDPLGVSDCALGDLAAGTTAQYSITVDVDLLTSGDLANTAVVSSSVTDPVPSNNTVTETTTVIAAQADLIFTLTNNAADPINPGTEFDLFMTASNSGPQVAVNAVATVMLPPELSFVTDGALGVGCALFADGVVSWPIGDLPVGATLTCDFRVQVVGIGEFQAVGQLVSDVQDPEPSNNIGIFSGLINAVALAVPAVSPLGLVVLLTLVFLIGILSLKRRMV